MPLWIRPPKRRRPAGKREAYFLGAQTFKRHKGICVAAAKTEKFSVFLRLFFARTINFPALAGGKIRFQTFNKMEKERKRNIDRRKEICYTYDNDNQRTFGNYGGRYGYGTGISCRKTGVRDKKEKESPMFHHAAHELHGRRDCFDRKRRIFCVNGSNRLWRVA